MANTFVTLKEIARQALPVLHQNLLFPNIIYTDYAQDFHGVGDTVKVRTPVIYEAGDFNEASGVQWQDIVEDSVEVTLDHIATVDARASAIETATCIDDLNRVFVEPAAIAIAEKINSDGLNLYKDVFRRVGTAGQTPSKLSDIAAARKALNLAQAPTTGRCAVWDVDADANFMSLDALVNAEKAGSNQALREGSIGRIYGMDNYMSQAVKKHETGITSAAGVKVNGAVAAGSTHVSIDGTKLEGYLKKGDLLTIGGGEYVVVKDTSAAAGNAIAGVEVYPPMPQTADDAEVTLVGSHVANLAFHPMAFAYVTRPLSNPDGQGVESYVTSYNGLSLRVTRGYDQQYKRSVYSMDVLYGFKTIYPELAARILG